MIFVFGSNEAGIHGAGAAHVAHKLHGARWGYGWGHHGNSFAIPTKNRYIESLDMGQIGTYVNSFLAFAKHHRELSFQVTRVGCGLAGRNDEEMAKLFKGGQPNIFYDKAWKPYLDKDSLFWGTF